MRGASRTDLLLTVLRGLRSRALLSTGSLVLVALAVGATVLGPMFQAASIRSYTLTRVEQASAPQTALTWSVKRRAVERPLEDLVSAATTRIAALSPDLYDAPETTLVSKPVKREPDEALVRFFARAGACAILEVTGRCPERAGEVLVNEVDLVLGEIGDEIVLPVIGTQVVVGVYRTPTTTGDWLFPALLTGTQASGFDASGPAPYLITEDAFGALPGRLQTVLLDSRLSPLPPDLDDDSFDRLVTGTAALLSVRERLEGGGVLVGESPVNALDDVLDDVRAQRAAARSAVAPAVISLILVALAMILRLLGAAAELRVPELALAALRGVDRRRVWLLGLSEPWLILTIGAPLGAAVGWLAALALVRSGLRPGIPVPVPAGSLVGALLVVVAIAGVAVLAVWQVQRVSLGSRLAGVRRPGRSSRGALVAELVLVLLAAALLLGRLLGDGGPLDLGDLILPVVVAVAAGLLLTRATTAVTGWWTRRGTGGPIAAFVAARAVSRRTQGTLLMLPVTAAIAVSVFAVGLDGVAADWRASVAATRTPADLVYASPLTLEQTLALSRTADPDGQYSMALGRANLPTGPLVLLDASRLGRVGTWPEQWLDGRTAAEVGALLAPTTPTPVLQGSRFSITVANTAGDATGAGLVVRLDLHVSGGGDERVSLGPFPRGTTTAAATSEACDAGCELRGLVVGGDVGTATSLRGTVELADLAVDGAVVDDALVADTWVPDTLPGDETVATDIRPAERGLAFDVDTGSGVATLQRATGVGSVPVLVGGDAADTVTTVDGEQGVTVVSARVPVTVAGRTESTPLLGPRGVVVDLSTLLARTVPASALVEPLLLVRDDAPAPVTDAITAAGLVVVSDADETRTALEAGAYAQALRLYRAVAATILLMALGGLLVGVATQLPARRRDAASLRVVGVPRRTVVAAAFGESVVVLVASAVAGLGAGLLAEALLLRSLTLGVADDVTTPPVVPALDVGLVALFAAVVTGALVLVSAGTSAAVVRRARAATLRESAR